MQVDIVLLSYYIKYVTNHTIMFIVKCERNEYPCETYFGQMNTWNTIYIFIYLIRISGGRRIYFTNNILDSMMLIINE